MIVREMCVSLLLRRLLDTEQRCVLLGYTAPVRSAIEDEMKRQLRVGGPETLNLYIRNLIAEGVLGYATFPWNYAAAPEKDGIVITVQTLANGTHPFYSEGDSLAHEIGHWL